MAKTVIFLYTAYEFLPILLFFHKYRCCRFIMKELLINALQRRQPYSWSGYYWFLNVLHFLECEMIGIARMVFGMVECILYGGTARKFCRFHKPGLPPSPPV